VAPGHWHGSAPSKFGLALCPLVLLLPFSVHGQVREPTRAETRAAMAANPALPDYRPDAGCQARSPSARAMADCMAVEVLAAKQLVVMWLRLPPTQRRVCVERNAYSLPVVSQSFAYLHQCLFP
jgi:hypothetical protein